MERRSYSPEVKSRALADLALGGRVFQIARDHDIPEGTVKTWKRRMKRGEIVGLKPEKKDSPLGRLLEEHLRVSVGAMTKDMEHLSRVEVICSMKAGDLAIFFGTLFDRTERMIELFPATGASETYIHLPKR